MGNSSSGYEDFSKTIDFCKQLRLLHFVVNDPEAYSDELPCLKAFSSLEATHNKPLRSQHRELDKRIAEIDFEQYRLMFSIRRILFSVPFRGAIIGYVLVDAGGKSRRVNYILNFETHEHRPVTHHAEPTAHDEEKEYTCCYNSLLSHGSHGRAIKTYRAQRSYSEFLQLDSRIQSLFVSEHKDMQQFQAEMDRHERFAKQLKKAPHAKGGSNSSQLLAVECQGDESKQEEVQEVKIGEDQVWINIQSKQTLQVEEKEIEGQGKEKTNESQRSEGYASLHLPTLPPKQFCWDDASRLAVAEERMPVLNAYLQAIFANPLLANHDIFLQFLFSPDSFGDDAEGNDSGSSDGEDELETGKRAEAATTPKTRHRSNYGSAVKNAAAIEEYDLPPPEARLLTDGGLAIIDEWERVEVKTGAPCQEGRPRAEKEQSSREERFNTGSMGAEVKNNTEHQRENASSAADPELLEEAIEELFGTSPFSIIPTVGDMNEASNVMSSTQPEGDTNEASNVMSSTQSEQPRLLTDDWSFLSVEMAICKRRSGRKRKQHARREQGEEGVDSEMKRFIERTRTIETLEKMKARELRKVGSGHAYLPGEGENKKGLEAGEGEGESEEEEEGRHRRVMKRLNEAEEWVNKLDYSRQNKKKQRWRVANIEYYVLSTGTGELSSVLRTCLEKQARTLMVAHGIASSKTGAIMASKKGMATLIYKSLTVLGFTTSGEVKLMMAACLHLALSRVLLFLRLSSVEAFLSSRFFIHSATYFGRVASMSAISAARLIAKANILSSVVAFLVEEIYLFVLFIRVWKFHGQAGLGMNSFVKGTMANITSNASGYAGAIVGGTIGTILEPGGGTIIGSLVGGILCRFLISFGSNYIYTKLYGDEEEEGESTEMMQFAPPTEEEEEQAEEEEWEILTQNISCWEELLAEFEQIDGNEYDESTADNSTTHHSDQIRKKGEKEERGASMDGRRKGKGGEPLLSKWSKVMEQARRRRKSKYNTREGLQSQEPTTQGPN